MALSPELINNVKNSEGCRLEAYKDSLGYWTIGYGHKDQTGPDWSGQTITLAEAEALLSADLNYAQETAAHLPEWPSLDTTCRQDAVIELVFNMGSRWRSFIKCRYGIQMKNWQVAHDELLNSEWHTQVGDTRANRIALQLLNGFYGS